MALETVNYQCPNCNGPLHFESESGKVRCDYCDSSFTIQEVEAFYAEKQAKADAKAKAAEEKQTAKEQQAAAAGGEQEAVEKQVATPKVTKEDKERAKVDPIGEYLRHEQWDESETSGLVSYTCSSCAAELFSDGTTAVTECPYCGNPTVVPGALGGSLKPDFVIPFKKTKEDVIAGLKQYYEGKKFLPGIFKNTNRIEKVQGVYVPFWLYDSQTKGSAEFEATNVMMWEDGNFNYTKTDYYDVTRSGHLDFEKVPADGSLKMPDAHMDAIEPFDYSELKEFSMAYLPGYLTDRYDVGVDECKDRVSERMKGSLVDAFRDTVEGYTGGVSVLNSEATVDFKNVSYALLPVWMLHTKWQDKDYLFAMNGQTGKFIGDLPVSKAKVAAWFLGMGIPLAAVITAILYFVIGL